MTLDLGKNFLPDGSSASLHVVSSSPDTNTASSHSAGDEVPVKVTAQNSMGVFRIGPLDRGRKQIKQDVNHGAFCGGIASAQQVQMGLFITRPSPEEELNLDCNDDVAARKFSRRLDPAGRLLKPAQRAVQCNGGAAPQGLLSRLPQKNRCHLGDRQVICNLR
ncbi:MAG: hypothetical protein O9292_10045 [Rhodobacteraceae bacterium]|nr:hypothetical protein [Paracoccaceae bacterium]